MCRVYGLQYWPFFPVPVLGTINTGINAAQICGGIRVFGIPVLEALVVCYTYTKLTLSTFHNFAR